MGEMKGRDFKVSLKTIHESLIKFKSLLHPFLSKQAADIFFLLIF